VTLVQQLAEHVVRTARGNLPEGVLDKAALCVIDAIGCMLIGSKDRVARTVADHAVQRGAMGPSTIVGRSIRVGPEYASAANGTAAHLPEWDDGHRPSGDHLGSVVVPAAMAMAEAVDASVADLLLAVVVGYDAMGRVGESVALPRGEGRYFHGNGVNGGFGAAAAAAKLLGLTNVQVMNALAIAGDGASSLREFRPTGTDMKAFHEGRAAYTGITAAYLAAAGMRGSETIFEGHSGYCGAISPQPRPQLIVAELGNRFAIIETGFKVYPCLGTLQLPVEAVLLLRSEHRIDPASIRRITIALPDWARSTYDVEEESQQRRPTTLGNARFSMSFTVAAALMDGELTQRQFTEQKLLDPQILALEAVMNFVHDEEVEGIFRAQSADEPFFFVPVAVTIEARGKNFRKLVRSPEGYDPKGRGLTPERVLAKFHSIADSELSQATANEITERILGMSDRAKVTDTIRLLGGDH
jgi:2-methylcitrate dehydratase PrpD